MKLQLRKRKKQNFRKLIKTDAAGNMINSDPIYVLLNEVEGNVENEGTAITPEVLEKINWKDATEIEFIPLSTDDLPEAKEDVIQIISKHNGEIWCIPTNGTKDAFPLGNSDFSNLLKKYEANYSRGTTFKFFVLDKEAKIFANRMRIGSIPKREIEDDSMTDGTYIDMNSTGNIVMYINGTKAHEFTKEKVLLKNKESTIGINSDGIVKLEATGSATSVKLIGPTFSISSPNTDVEEADKYTKFNCHTKLPNASYGNQNFRLQFYPDYVRLKDLSDSKNERTIIQINKSGLIQINSGNILINDQYVSLTHPMGFSSRASNVTWGNISEIGNLITAWTYLEGGIQFRYLGNKLYVGIDGEFYQNEGNYKLIDENSVNNYIKNYFDSHFEDEYRKYLEKYENRKLLYDGGEQTVTILLSDSPETYEIKFSTTKTDTTKSIIFKGTDIGTIKARIYDETKNCYYRVYQYIVDDDQYDDYIEVQREDANGAFKGREFIRALYRF